MTEQPNVYNFDEAMKRRWSKENRRFSDLQKEIGPILDGLKEQMVGLEKELKLAKEQENEEGIRDLEDEILYLHEQLGKAIAPLLELRKKLDESRRKYLVNRDKQAREKQ